MTMPEDQANETESHPETDPADPRSVKLYKSYIHNYYAHLAVLWTLLYRFGIFPNHPSPDMLECHEEVYYNNQTEAVERDKTCELDRSLIWGLSFLAGLASAVFTPVLVQVLPVVILFLYASIANRHGLTLHHGLTFWSMRFCLTSGPFICWEYLDFEPYDLRFTIMLCVLIYTNCAPIAVLWTLLYGFVIFPQQMWGWAFLAGVASAVLNFFILLVVSEC